MNFYKRPGVAETLDWASALIALNRRELDDKDGGGDRWAAFLSIARTYTILREQVERKSSSIWRPCSGCRLSW